MFVFTKGIVNATNILTIIILQNYLTLKNTHKWVLIWPYTLSNFTTDLSGHSVNLI